MNHHWRVASALLAGRLTAGAFAGPIPCTWTTAGRLVLVNYGGNTNRYKLYDNAGNRVGRSAPGPQDIEPLSPRRGAQEHARKTPPAPQNRAVAEVRGV